MTSQINIQKRKHNIKKKGEKIVRVNSYKKNTRNLRETQGVNKISIDSSIKNSKISDLYKHILNREQIHHWILLVKIQAAMQKCRNIPQILLICTWNKTMTAFNFI